METLAGGEALLAGQAVARHVAVESAWQQASSVALYSMLPGEVDSTPLIQMAEREGKKLLFPRMVPGPSLEFVYVAEPASLRPGRYGVLEPDRHSPSQRLTREVVVLVPGLAFDRRGGRLGRGAGYYDRALAVVEGTLDRPRLIGVGFAFQFVESIPVSSIDVRMDGIVTEQEFCWVT